jgi:hypothetical protein
VGLSTAAKRKVHSVYGIEPVSYSPWPVTLLTEPSWLTHMNCGVVINHTQIYIISLKYFNALAENSC